VKLYLFDPSHLAAFQANLDAVGMKRGLRQDIFDYAFGQLAGALVFLQSDQNMQPRSDVSAICSVHSSSILTYIDVDMARIKESSASRFALNPLYPPVLGEYFFRNLLPSDSLPSRKGGLT
jgi:hypothetical protein